MTEFFKFSKRSLKEVLDELTENKDLKAVLAYNFGDYGKVLIVLCSISWCGLVPQYVIKQNFLHYGFRLVP